MPREKKNKQTKRERELQLPVTPIFHGNRTQADNNEKGKQKTKRTSNPQNHTRLSHEETGRKRIPSDKSTTVPGAFERTGLSFNPFPLLRSSHFQSSRERVEKRSRKEMESQGDCFDF